MNRSLLIWVLLLSACQASAPAPGRIEVEVYRGLSGPSGETGSLLPKVHLLVDATLSMSEQTGFAAHHLLAARAKATELVRSLPAGTDISLHAFGFWKGETSAEVCAPGELLARGNDAAGRRYLLDQLRRLSPAGEGSAAGALGALTEELRSSGARDARVVLFTDLDPTCGGDLCAAARALVDAGAWLDVVVHGDASAPACLAQLVPREDVPSPYVRSLSGGPPAFRIDSLPAPLGRTGGTLARGTVGTGAASVPAGEVEVVLELDPPRRFGPVRIAPDRLTRVRIVDFASAAGQEQPWHWMIVDDQP
jgi:hypothetical protein